ncbi:MAG: LysR family transcriptional regulator [Pseudomonas marincola]
MESWDDLKYALAVHRHGGLSGAARSLGVNHSTVSRRLSTLEKSMGVRLFDRFASGLRVTSFGEHAILAAESMEELALALDLSIAGRDMELAGPLKVSAPQLIIKVVLAPVLAEFAKIYPNIKLTVIATSDAVNLHKREADVSILASNEPDGTLWGRKVLSQNCRYYGERKYLAGCDQASELDCINFLWRGDDPAAEILKAYPRARVTAKFDDMVAVHGTVLAGSGVARMPCFLGGSTEELEALPYVEKQPYSDIWVLTHPDLQKLPRIRTFMRYISEKLKEKEKLFLGE